MLGVAAGVSSRAVVEPTDSTSEVIGTFSELVDGITSTAVEVSIRPVGVSTVGVGVEIMTESKVSGSVGLTGSIGSVGSVRMTSTGPQSVTVTVTASVYYPQTLV